MSTDRRRTVLHDWFNETQIRRMNGVLLQLSYCWRVVQPCWIFRLGLVWFFRLSSWTFQLGPQKLRLPSSTGTHRNVQQVGAMQPDANRSYCLTRWSWFFSYNRVSLGVFFLVFLYYKVRATRWWFSFINNNTMCFLPSWCCAMSSRRVSSCNHVSCYQRTGSHKDLCPEDA